MRSAFNPRVADPTKSTTPSGAKNSLNRSQLPPSGQPAAGQQNTRSLNPPRANVTARVLIQPGEYKSYDWTK